jgi:hypothetical protein
MNWTTLSYMYDIVSLGGGYRRQTARFRLNLGMSQYVGDDGFPGLAMNVSENGLSLRQASALRAPARPIVTLELELPGTNEIIWTSAQPRFHNSVPGFQVSGLHFLSMARKHRRLLSDYVRERQERLQRLLAPRTVFHSRFGALVS